MKRLLQSGMDYRNLRRMVISAAIAVILSSCMSLVGEKKKTVTPAPKAQTEISAADSVAKFLMTAENGDRRRITLNDGREVTVVAGENYTSALGLRCRRASIGNRRGESLVNAACLENAVWRTVIKP